MSLRLTCPHCGTRPIEEWIYGEILDVPADLVDAGDVALDRGFFHTNREGDVEEAWFHLYGCRRWVRIGRDTRTDEVH